MLRIRRPKEIPNVLLSPWVATEKKKILSYLRRDSAERRQRRDGLNDDVLMHKELLEPLYGAFEGRCAFCERYVYDGAKVHHLRPLRFATTHGESNQDYYLWLAFEWRNLFLSCIECSKHQGSQFPIDGPRGSYLSSFDDLVRRERSLLIDPTVIEPSRHLRFHLDGEVVPLSEMGLTTIKLFGLGRDDLVLSRRRALADLLTSLTTSQADHWIKGVQDSDHIGCQVNVLKRLANLWLGAGRLPSGSGTRFLTNFLARWKESSDADRHRLVQLVQQFKRTDHEMKSEYHLDGPYLGFQRLHSIALELNLSKRVPSEQISSIKVSNYKAIGSLTLELSQRRSEKSSAPSLMIIGENSTGKSSLLSAIALSLVGEGEARKLRDYFPSLVRSVATDRFDQMDEEPVEVELGFHFSGHKAAFRYDPATRTIEATGHQSALVLGYGPRRYFDPKKVDRSLGSAARIRTLFDPLATIPYPGDWLRDQRGTRFESLARALRVVLSLDDNDELIVDPEQIAVRTNGRITSLDALSEGYKSVFVMTVDIIRELLDHWDNLESAEAIVLIDEIETHLHPRWKMQVMNSLRRALPRVQFIATTHDPLCLRGMDDEEVAVLQRTEDGGIAKLNHLPSIRGMSTEQLLTSDYFGLVSTADPSTEIGLARLAGDVASQTFDGRLHVATSLATAKLIGQLTIGDSPSEQIIQEAVMEYLRKRAISSDSLRPVLRRDAVDAVLQALENQGFPRR